MAYDDAAQTENGAAGTTGATGTDGAADGDEVREGFHVEHVAVSEASEGQPWFEWIIAGCITLAVIAALTRHITVGVGILVLTSWLSALVRLFFGDDSPWKVRSRAFDVAIGLCLGLGIAIVYYSIMTMY